MRSGKGGAAILLLFIALSNHGCCQRSAQATPHAVWHVSTDESLGQGSAIDPTLEFWTRYDSVNYTDYYSPFGNNNIYFNPGRPLSPLRLIIGAGFGRTGTVSLAKHLRENGTNTFHFATPVKLLVNCDDPTQPSFHELFPPRFDPTKVPARVSRGKYKFRPGIVAFCDNPTGFYVWDLMSAYQEYDVALTVREPDAWFASLKSLEIIRGAWGIGSDNYRMFANGKTFPSVRQALRRYFEHNTKVIVTVPEERFTLIDYTRENAVSAITRLMGRPPVKGIEKTHSTKTSVKRKANVTQFVDASILNTSQKSGIEQLREANPAGLDVMRYMNPMMALRGVPNTKHFFSPDRVVSSHPLIINAGFDGTGLVAFGRAMAKLGYPSYSIKYPGIPMPGRKDTLKNCDLATMMANGLQSASVSPRDWHNTSVIMGHPVNNFLWDFLEAFPNAKVVLTVRKVDQWLRTVHALNSASAMPRYGKAHAWLKSIVWGLRPDEKLYPTHMVRRYLEGNAKVIHGVPKKQLFVWDMEEHPSWEGICDFLGLPVPKTPFPGDIPEKPEF